MATINDVAKLAGVSPTTAKRAINEPHKLQPQTLEKVQWAIQQLDYEPDLTAGALRRGRNLTVGLLVADIVEPFFAELAREIGVRLRNSNYGLLLADNEYQTEIELHNLRHLAGQRVSALIMRPSYGPGNREYLLKMQDKGTYIIEVDHHMPDSPFDYLMLDHEQCIRMGLEHLWKLGHTRIAGLGTHHPELYPEWRAHHFDRIMREHGHPVLSAYREIIRYNEQDAYEFTRYLLNLQERPTALFAFNGTEAIGAYRAIQEAGLSIPEDISLLAFDNLPWTALVKPGIDVIEQPIQQMGELLVHQVLKNMDGPRTPLHKLLPGKLIVRGSCGGPSGK
ncbi:LacI family DNA-binding transcriptional regulator [Deinococcus cellulosilyticus]|uniref:LacI family transcriptional regulator n=1 Tax=Deinococcus cellulosilyticus (strain DSM 18568 / NBRC 106333 / KACC 11606 / 5516J-15) TaxID=1223518 RepID=A0A511N2R3_DEIC1|nr:LacI family DNA-binding transcriptional regulator [Deinococcus cellulosilyticus]GEM47145.1 LacI family transcriptional regulator [Deinococcus cellulosilyticus NBRC 106333 = KACC 11606]